MRFFPLFSQNPAPLSAGPILLRQPKLSDYPQWLLLRSESREFLAPWESLWASMDLSRHAYKEMLRNHQLRRREGSAYYFFMVSQEKNKLVGGINLYNVERGSSMAATLGYWVGEPYLRRGYATAAIAAITAFAFDELRLARLTAACLPKNERSRKLLEKCGFTHEGVARSYMEIAGRREDHLFFSLLPSDRRPRP